MNTTVTCTILVLLVMHACGCASTGSRSADIKPGSLLQRSVSIDGTDHKYAIWIPESYNPKSPSPCVVFLHGSGECGTDGLKQTTVGLLPAAKADPKQWPFVIVMPQKPTQPSEWEEHEAMVLAALEQTRKELKIDPKHITLTGLSQGGHGTWMIGARHTDLFAAFVPVCGYSHPNTVAPRLAGHPVWAFHGGKDDIVPVSESERMIAAIKKQGKSPEPRLTVFPEANHNSWNKAYRESGLGEWLLRQ